MSESEILDPAPAPITRQLEIKPLRLADAAVLRGMGVFSGSLKKVQALIRHLIALNGHGCFMVTGCIEPRLAEAQAGEGTGDTGLSGAFDATGFVALLPDAFSPEIGRLTVRATHADFLPDLLELACRTAFCEQPFLRIESLVPSFPEAPLRQFRDFGFRTDAIVPGALLRSPDRMDQHLLSLPKTLNRYPGVGVVAYKLGLLSVTGTETRIDAVDFHLSGEPVANPYLRDLFYIWGLLDEKERLRSTEACVKLIRNDALPEMVAKAVSQLQEYMAGARQTFDLNLNLSSGSPFQQAVWAALQTIPYGTTETYLDIALKLADGDLKKARAMSRAVGSACGANPVPVVVPCHRVIGRNGRLIGFSGGIENKEYLLEHELFRRR